MGLNLPHHLGVGSQLHAMRVAHDVCPRPSTNHHRDLGFRFHAQLPHLLHNRDLVRELYGGETAGNLHHVEPQSLTLLKVEVDGSRTLGDHALDEASRRDVYTVLVSEVDDLPDLVSGEQPHRPARELVTVDVLTPVFEEVSQVPVGD